MSSNSETRYGHLIENWQAAKQELFDILVDCARQRQTITYGEICDRLHTISIAPHSYAMSGLLRDVIREDETADRADLATLVVRKSDGRPGAGYFQSAVERGLSDTDLEAYWQQKFEEVCAYYADNNP